MKKLCSHLIEDELVGGSSYDLYYQFTGIGTEYNLICHKCYENQEYTEHLQAVSDELWAKVEYLCEGYVGYPEVKERSTNLHFVHETPISLAETIILVAPADGSQDVDCFAITADAKVIAIDFDPLKSQTVYHIQAEDQLNLDEALFMFVSPQNRFLAIVNQNGRYGIVIDVQAQAVILRLDRGEYRYVHSLYPVGFFEKDEAIYIAHGTNWNRLDISRLPDGKIMTERDFIVPDGERHSPHYLDYFHARLAISPNAQWIAEEGWVWQPFGILRIWNLTIWLEGNPYESEDGASCRKPIARDYHWDSPLCWIDDHTLAVWGFGDVVEAMIPAIQLFNLPEGKRERWFAGVQSGNLYFDEYLYSVSDAGTQVWNVQSGEKFLSDAEFRPLTYHAHLKRFISLRDTNQLFLTSISES